MGNSLPHSPLARVGGALHPFAPVAARGNTGGTEQTRSDAVVGVIRDWLHNPRTNDAEGAPDRTTPLT
ncbi:hypothetical protein GCM10027057_12680 [Marisediminicola antarctica]